MPFFKVSGIIAASLFALTVLLGLNKSFKYHRYFALAALLFMLAHVAGAFGLY